MHVHITYLANRTNDLKVRQEVWLHSWSGSHWGRLGSLGRENMCALLKSTCVTAGLKQGVQERPGGFPWVIRSRSSAYTCTQVHMLMWNKATAAYQPECILSKCYFSRLQ